MRKGSGRPSSFGQNFMIFLLTGIAGYNSYETVQLKSEIADLKSKRLPLGAPSVTSRESSDPNPSSLFAQAQKEVGQAEAKLHLKDYARARTDLQQGVTKLEQANAQTRAEGEKVLAELRTAAQGLQDKTIVPAKADPSAAHDDAKGRTRSAD